MLKNRGKGWHIFFIFVVLVVQIFFSPRVLALEEEESSFTATEMTREDIFNSYSNHIEFYPNEVVVQSNFEEEMTVLEFLSHISILDLMNDDLVQSVYVVDSFGSILSEEDIIHVQDVLVMIGDEFICSYSIKILGDYNLDGILSEDDVDSSLEEVLHESEEITTEDVSYIDYVVENQTYEVPEVLNENLENHLEVDSSVYVSEEVVVKYSISGFDSNYVNAISGDIWYDEETLKLENVYLEVNGEIKGGISNHHFVYLLNDYCSENVFMILLFETLKSGNQQVRIDHIKAVMNGTLLKIEDSVSVYFMVEEYGKGGDIETIVTPDSPDESEASPSISPSFLPNEVKVSKPVIVATEISLSSNNYIKNLVIEGYSISFDKEVLEYSIEVDSDIDSLSLDVWLEHDNATYFVSGNEKFQKGKNKVILTVQAEDGSIRDYVIEVNKKGLEEDKKDAISETYFKKAILWVAFSIFVLAIICCLVWFIRKEE